MFVICDSVAYLGEGVFCDVLVGDVKGLDQLAGDLGVCRVSGLPIGACKKKKFLAWWYMGQLFATLVKVEVNGQPGETQGSRLNSIIQIDGKVAKQHCRAVAIRRFL